MKNKGIIITLIVTLLILCVILTAFLVVVLKEDIGVFNISNLNSDNITLDETYELENIDEIDISAIAGDINFEENENQNIRVVVKGKNNTATVNLEENKLKIECDEKPKINWFGINDSLNNIIIYIPKDYSKTISITNEYGNCEAIDLENATLNIKSSYGDVEIGKIKNAKIECNYGNIEIKEILYKCNIVADCGNVEIDKISIKENSIIKADLGNVEIGETNDIYIEASCDLGNTDINNNNRNAQIELEIECDCGNITVDN